MEQIFKSVLLLSLVGTILSGILFLLKPLTKRLFGSQWQYYIWLCVLVVMILPVSFKLPVEIDAIITTPKGEQVVQENNNTELNINTEKTLVDANAQTPIEHRNIDIVKGITFNLFDAIIYAWLLGIGVFFCGGLISYLQFLRTIRNNSTQIFCSELEGIKEKKGIKQKICVRTTELLTAPLMVGIFKPTLLLSNTPMSEKELHYILLHELTHLKRRDLWYKWFAMLVNSVHWFNPLTYFVVKQINEECEISCDLSVTRDMSEDEKNGYMSTILYLLSLNKEKSKILTTAMANNKKQIKRRFMMIKEATKKSKVLLSVSVVTAVIILGVTIFASGVLRNEIKGEDILNNQIAIFDVDAPVKDKTNILLNGVDEGMRCDTLIMLSLDNINKNLVVLSIPRDTLIKINNEDNKLSTLMTIDGKDQNIIDVVRNNFAIPVHYYLRMNLEGFRNIVDILGGVEFDVPNKMYYEDPAQNLRIDLEKGMQILDGTKAENLIRYRMYPDGDITRTKVQQDLIIELLKQKLNTKYLPKASLLYNEMSKHVITNYPSTEITKIIKILNEINFEDIKTFTLPGKVEARNGLAYYVVNDMELEKLMEQYFTIK